MKKILCIIGTRPEAIKMAPVIHALRETKWAQVHVLSTAQHRQLLDKTLEKLEITADTDLDLMEPNQSLGELAARLLYSISNVLDREKPVAVLAQGDTNTVLASALACFYKNIIFGHVEAGLRSGDMQSPFPEEMNRVLTARLATLHFAPTQTAFANLKSEGVEEKSIFLTGNTGIDTLFSVASRSEIPTMSPIIIPDGKRIILVTVHRRENFGTPLKNIFCAIRDLAHKYKDIHFIYPTHPNPNVLEPARQILQEAPGVTLCEPLGYFQLVHVMKKCHFVMTDSGGLQEEAPALAKPVLILRNNTERPEAVEAGVAQLVGTSYETITQAAERLLTNDNAYKEMAIGISPYGDGHAAGRIAKVLQDFFYSETKSLLSKTIHSFS